MRAGLLLFGLITLLSISSAVFAENNSALNGSWAIEDIYCMSGAEPVVRIEEMRDITFSFNDGKETVVNHLRGGCVATETSDYTINGKNVAFKSKLISYGPECGSNAGKTQTEPDVSNTFSVVAHGNVLKLKAQSIGTHSICPDGDIEVTSLGVASK